ncbi:uncharacterized protein PGTG_06164 [Puccinia graminis f. sp. tritici CRL 75-36-700-3]|uniref:Uncharacterized protein n=1 Tax=Puccinia graminis f. sp. tritici (strain CRL 75-36-700-3 / race SCCL) TaxID=418459 RepID=E3K7Y1_PUCGT|nr:uncharacterized protein PGTG_06164 [Puccinia graminis f. sp. tritici CRL 75-36-700-3]EFP80208.1 hypothetical protein PGTG_06164 [Puccinia graminis f. sp. tritici CRL 75-36-700-3]
MSDSESDFSLDPNTSGLIGTLEFMIDESKFPLDLYDYQKVDVQSPAKLGQNEELLNGTKHTKLLLSIKEQLNSLVAALGLLDPTEEPIPDIDLALMDENHKNLLKHLKAFRFSPLHDQICDLIKFDINMLFEWYLLFIESYKRPSKLSAEESEHQAKRGQRIIEGVTDCDRAIDDIIKWSKRSDFAILRQGWLKTIESLNETSERIEIQLNPKGKLPRIAGADDQRRAEDRHAEEIISGAGKSVILLLKLTRILSKKLMEITKNNSPLILDSKKIDCRALNLLADEPDSMSRAFDDFANFAQFSFRPIRNLALIRAQVNLSSEILEPIFLVLDSHVITLEDGIDHSSAKDHFNAWSLNMKDLWHKAANRFLEDLTVDDDWGPP